MKTIALIAALGWLGFVTAGCQSGNPQAAPPEHAGHHAQHGQHGEHGKKKCGGKHAHGAGEHAQHKKPCACRSGAKAAAADGAPAAFDQAPAAGTAARCPVMGRSFTVADDTTRSEHDGKHYVFCCAGCKERFEAAPASFLENR